MIILDTNVVSEPIKPDGSTAVRAWLDNQVAETLYLTATSLAELLMGVAILPKGKRRASLAEAVDELLHTLFGARILPFDERAAEVYAALVARAGAKGRRVSLADGQIASIAHARGFKVATRDVAPFVAFGVDVINPWTAGTD